MKRLLAIPRRRPALLPALAAALALLLATGVPALAQSGSDPFAAASEESGKETDPFAAFGGGDSGSGGDVFAEAFGDTGGGGFGEAAGPSGPVFTGMVQAEQAHHIGPDQPDQRDIILNNVRGRLKTSLTGEQSSAYLTVDFLQDDVLDESRVELREARILFTPMSWMDVNVGVQVSTWGVGDMLFINDLFPKNWVANFTGQELEYLKEPANAVRASAYAGDFTFDLVYTPQFEPDVVPVGCRFTVFDPNAQSVGYQPQACDNPPELLPQNTDQGEDGEVASRVMTSVGTMQVALYGYRGFWKSPKGLMWVDPTGEPVTGMPTPGTDVLMPYHPRLNVYGASAEGQVGPGILALEAGFYDSVEDRSGDDPLIENSLWKALLGYRMDFSATFSAGLQWYAELMEDYPEYEQAYTQAFGTNPAIEPRDERRDTYTVRLTWKLQQETLFLNVFSYNRPQDQDAFHKLWVTKRVDNHLEVSTGANVFEGEQDYRDREFGMLADDDNAFVRFTYNF